MADTTATPAPPANSNPANVPYTDSAPAGGGTPPPPPPPPEPTAAGTSAEIPAQPTAQPGAAPGALIPAKRGGLAGVLDEVRNWIAGTNSTQVYIDPNSGERYVQHPMMSHKQQWLKVAGEGLVGGAAGLAAGKGAGNGGRALYAGVLAQHQLQQEATDRQEENADQDYTRARQNRIDKASAQMAQMQIAEVGLRMNREKTLATQSQVKWSMDMNASYESQHAQFLGNYNSDDIHNIEKAHPDVWKAHFNDNTIKPVPQFTPDGTPAGVNFYLTHPNLDNQPLKPGTKVSKFVPSDDASKPGHMVQEDPAPGMSQGEYDFAQATQYKRLADDVDRVQKMNDSETQRQLREETIKDAPLRHQKLIAEINHENAETDKAQQQAQSARTMNTIGSTMTPEQAIAEQPVNGVRVNFLNSIPADTRELVRAIGEGRKTDVSNYALSRPNSPGAALARAVTMAYPGYDFTRADAYKKNREYFTSNSKGALGVNALNTAMNHMEVMYDNASFMNSAPVLSSISRMFGKQGAIDLSNAKAALVDEIGTAYKSGALTIEDKKTWTNQIDNWSPAEIRGNAKSFIKLLNGKLESQYNQWRNGSPPGAVAPIQFMSPQAQQAYRHITGEEPPTYDAGGAAQVSTGTTNGAGAGAPPAGATMKVPDQNGVLHWSDGKNDLGVVR